MIGRADLDIRWFNRRDRVLANDRYWGRPRTMDERRLASRNASARRLSSPRRFIIRGGHLLVILSGRRCISYRPTCVVQMVHDFFSPSTPIQSTLLTGTRTRLRVIRLMLLRPAQPLDLL